MNRVLAIPELLDLICHSLSDSNSSLLSAALVSKRWSGPALDELWREVLDIRVLFTLLAPVQGEPDIAAMDEDADVSLRDVCYHFTRPVLPADWTRFSHYGRRVRALYVNAIPFPDSSQYRDVFDEIARTRTSLNVLPNLRSLSWDIHLHHAVIFMHPNITEFSFPVSSPGKYDLGPCVNDITTRMPKLETLHLYPTVPVREIEDTVLSLFEGGNMQSLKKIVVPKHFTTTKITEALSGLPALKILEFRYDMDDHSCPSDVANFSPSLATGSFPALEDLSLTVPLTQVINLYSTPTPPTNLTILYLHSYLTEYPTTLHTLLTTLSATCHNLTALSILSSIRATSPERITYETLAPVLEFKGLKQFEVIHHNAVDVSLGEVEHLAEHWPHLESLVLGNEPYNVFADAISSHEDHTYHETNSLTAPDLSCALPLQALHPFAKHCPNLTKLGLFIDARWIPEDPPRDEVLEYGFVRPVTLVMGLSTIGSPGDVALYLSRLVGPSISLPSSTSTSSTNPSTPPPNPLTIEAGISVDEITNDPRTSLVQLRDPLRQHSDGTGRDLAVDDLGLPLSGGVRCTFNLPVRRVSISFDRWKKCAGM
jgi:hypothetical protein